MLRSRALVIPLLAFVILLLVTGVGTAYGQETDNPVPRTGIRVTQTCPARAAVGEEITYVVTVINTGEEPLKGIKVEGSLLGDLGDAFSDNLDVGGQESRSFTHVVTEADPNPLESVVTARTEGTITDESENDTVACSTEIAPAQAVRPAIEVAKSCPATGTVGNTITYTIRVMNTGEEPVRDIAVRDSILGDLSDSFPDELALGQSEGIRVDKTLGQGDAGILVNEVTVLGSGASSGVAVSDTASCETSVQAVLPTQFLPRTGVGLPGLAATGLGFVMLGAAMVHRSYRGPRLAPIPLSRRLAGRSRWAWGTSPSWRVLAWIGHERDWRITQAHVMRRSILPTASRRLQPSGE